MLNSRDDTYASKRDYQQFRDCTAVALSTSRPAEEERFALFSGLADGTTRFLCGGGYLRSDEPRTVRLALVDGTDQIASRDVRVGDYLDAQRAHRRGPGTYRRLPIPNQLGRR